MLSLSERAVRARPRILCFYKRTVFMVPVLHTMRLTFRVPVIVVLTCPMRVLLAEDAVPIGFTDVAAKSGVTLTNVCGAKETKDYIIEVNGNRAAFFDYDNDGRMDLLLVNGSTLDNLTRGGDPMAALYRNDGNGKFSDKTSDAKLHREGWGMGVCVADYDNDGYQDVYLTAYGPDVLYKNNGDGTFSDVTKQAGIANTRWATNCAFGDYDLDGDVDLYVANVPTF